MLDVMKNQSTNIFTIVGVLNTLDIKEGTSSKTNDDWISCEATVRVDQEIDGQLTENIIPVRLFSMRHKADKSLNKNYDRLKDYKEKLVALDACDPGQEDLASKVAITASAAENMFAGRDGRVIDKALKLSTNFINEKRASDQEGASFEVTGSLINKHPELNRDGEETGRLIVTLCIVGYNGTANVLEFIADGSRATHIDQNWEVGETVKAGGIIAMTNKIVEWTEETGFGEPFTHRRTETRRELIITRGSQAGLDEELSYDGDEIRKILADRKAIKDGLEKSASGNNKKPSDSFGF